MGRFNATQTIKNQLRRWGIVTSVLILLAPLPSCTGAAPKKSSKQNSVSPNESEKVSDSVSSNATGTSIEQSISALNNDDRISEAIDANPQIKADLEQISALSEKVPDVAAIVTIESVLMIDDFSSANAGQYLQAMASVLEAISNQPGTATLLESIFSDEAAKTAINSSIADFQQNRTSSSLARFVGTLGESVAKSAASLQDEASVFTSLVSVANSPTSPDQQDVLTSQQKLAASGKSWDEALVQKVSMDSSLSLFINVVSLLKKKVASGNDFENAVSKKRIDQVIVLNTADVVIKVDAEEYAAALLTFLQLMHAVINQTSETSELEGITVTVINLFRNIAGSATPNENLITNNSIMPSLGMFNMLTNYQQGVIPSASINLIGTLPSSSVNNAGEAAVAYAMPVSTDEFDSVPSPSDVLNNTQIFVGTRDGSGTWTWPTTVADGIVPDTFYYCRGPKVGKSSSATFVMVVCRYYLTRTDRVLVFENSGSGFVLVDNGFNVPTMSNIPSSEHQYAKPLATFAVNEAGDAVVAWSHLTNDGTAQKYFRAIRASDGTWTKPTSESDAILSQNLPNPRYPHYNQFYSPNYSEIESAINSSGEVILAIMHGTMVYSYVRTLNTSNNTLSWQDGGTHGTASSNIRVDINDAGLLGFAFRNRTNGTSPEPIRLYYSARPSPGINRGFSGVQASVNGDCNSPFLDINNAGQMIVAYRKFAADYSSADLLVTTVAPTTYALNIDSNPIRSAANPYYPSFTSAHIDSNGKKIVTYLQNGVLHRRSADFANSFGAEETISASGFGPVVATSLYNAISPNGGSIVDVYGQRQAPAPASGAIVIAVVDRVGASGSWRDAPSVATPRPNFPFIYSAAGWMEAKFAVSESGNMLAVANHSGGQGVNALHASEILFDGSFVKPTNADSFLTSLQGSYNFNYYNTVWSAGVNENGTAFVAFSSCFTNSCNHQKLFVATRTHQGVWSIANGGEPVFSVQPDDWGWYNAVFGAIANDGSITLVVDHGRSLDDAGSDWSNFTVNVVRANAAGVWTASPWNQNACTRCELRSAYFNKHGDAFAVVRLNDGGGDTVFLRAPKVGSTTLNSEQVLYAGPLFVAGGKLTDAGEMIVVGRPGGATSANAIREYRSQLSGNSVLQADLISPSASGRSIVAYQISVAFNGDGEGILCYPERIDADYKHELYALYRNSSGNWSSVNGSSQPLDFGGSNVRQQAFRCGINSSGSAALLNQIRGENGISLLKATYSASGSFAISATPIASQADENFPAGFNSVLHVHAGANDSFYMFYTDFQGRLGFGKF